MFLRLSLNILLHIVVMAMAFSSNCLIPHQYDLKLKLESKYVLKGESNIMVYINCTIQNITFHKSKYINVLKVNMKSIVKPKIYTPNLKFAYGNVVLNFEEELGPDNNLEKGFYILNIEFENFISAQLPAELLRTYWYNYTQTNEWMIAILNKPRTARELFPCFDEPELKATFNISIEHDIRYRTLSNMPIKEYDFKANGIIMLTQFQRTSRISPNDVAILIHEDQGLHPIHIFNWNKTVINTWCRPHFARYVKFGLYVATKIILHLEREWNILKDFSKVDYVAVPNFKNKIWRTTGLIIYNEADTTYNEKSHLPAHKFIMVRAIAHDIIIQWHDYFFNQHNSSHWWLNEGFILFFETYIVDQVLPDIRMMDLFVVEAKYESRFLTINGTTDTNNFTKDTSDKFKLKLISSFSPIKGALIWRMLLNVIPDYVFWTSMNKYLKLSNFTSRTPDDLWNVIKIETYKYFYSTSILEIVKEIMDIWSTQKYCPVVNVIRNYSNDQVIVSKEVDDKLSKTPYFIPVTYTFHKYNNFDAYLPNLMDCLTESRKIVEILLDKEIKWVIINLQQTGYYRVNYDRKSWQGLVDYLNSKYYSTIHVLNRAQIIDDAFYMAINGKLNFSIFWEFASYLWREKDYIAWYPMIKAFQYTSFIFAFANNPDELPKELQALLLKIKVMFLPIHKDMYDHDIYKTTNDLDKSLKLEVARIACVIGDSLCITAAKRQLELYVHESDRDVYSILPVWQKWTYCNGLKYANHSTWIYVWMEGFKIYREKSDYKMLEGLLCSNDPELIIDYLSYYLARMKNQIKDNKDGTIAKEVERKVNSLTANIFLSTLSRHAKNIEMLKKLLENYEKVMLSHVNINATLIVIVNNAYSSERLNEIYNFTKTLHISQLHLEYIKDTIRIRNRKISDQLEYFRNLYN